ncbi:hypothetical protein CC86DRAFT_281847 [Ophiobolus disseminans]|uniref:Uncharacterized protein n=1 Tax=Ophiobolus disseminans TaxID=1469910 RepID=A0A6A7AE82_9PLEO|nr:hypothetical protein CC86DRAFT_281847 [Ophiobolus disseminans]
MATATRYPRDGNGFEYGQDAAAPKDVFPFLRLPRELRDLIYDYTFQVEDNRSERALRIERRNLKHFKPSAAAILLVLHHEYLLLSRQVAREALEVLCKKHTIFLSCGPFILKALLERIEEPNGPGRQWLKWIKSIELDWVTFPDLRRYPPSKFDQGSARNDWSCEQDGQEVDVDYIRGATYSGHYDEHDHEGGHYDDNFYQSSDTTLYPSFDRTAAAAASHANDPFGFANHYPFADPSREPQNHSAYEDIATNLDLLVQTEVTPLFAYLATPTFNLTSITVPMYFISKGSHHTRSTSRPGYALPMKSRYWVQVCVHALFMLLPLSVDAPPPLQEVRVKYLPWDVWASVTPADDLQRIVEKGIWFDDAEDGERASEGEAFRAAWGIMDSLGWQSFREHVQADVTFVKWDGIIDGGHVGDELEVVFSRRDQEGA